MYIEYIYRVGAIMNNTELIKLLLVEESYNDEIF